ncbi:MAG: hypothetical protein M1536_01515 [Firmicutes bacterium]|nr:hypothetical protein [Bacillota bacterium]
MEPIKSAGISHAANVAISQENKALKPQPSAGLNIQDKVETTSAGSTREKRIAAALAKAGFELAGATKTGTAAWTGELVGTALGFTLLGGIYGPLIGGVIGAVAGVALDRPSVNKKVKEAYSDIKEKAASELKETGKHVKGAFQNVFNHSGVKESAGDSGEGFLISTGAGKSGKPAKESILGKIKKGLGFSAKGAKAIPPFLYPSIKNATPAEHKLIIDTLDKLPLKDVVSTQSITINPALEKTMNASGLARNLFFEKPIDLGKESMAVEGFNEGTIIHEVGHTRDFTEGVIPYVGRSSFKPFGKPPYVYDPWIDTPNDLYASTNHWEDFAQDHKFYHLQPSELEKTNPAKFKAMQELEKPGLYDKVMDRSGVRAAGRKLAELIDKVPGLRTAIDTIGTIMGPLEIHSGAGKIQDGFINKNDRKKLDGKLDMAAGVAFSLKAAAPAGLGIEGLRLYLNHQIKKGRMTVEEANKIADATLAASTGPAGLTAFAAVKELVGKEKIDYKMGKELSEAKLAESDKKYGKAMAVGTAAASATGAALGFYAGVHILGSLAAGLAIGATGAMAAIPIGVGIVALGRALRNIAKGEMEGVKATKALENKSGLTKDDKIFIAKVAGGAAIGGTAGTILGIQGGAIAGAVVGGLVGGPIGAGVGAFLGKVAGSLAGSYAGAKAGAKLGKLLDKGENKGANKADSAKSKNEVDKDKV